jgi:hypothetical protein
MNPLSNNGIEPVMRGLEKRGDERDPAPRRKRPAVREKAVADEEEHNEESGTDIPQHKLDDLA